MNRKTFISGGIILLNHRLPTRPSSRTIGHTLSFFQHGALSRVCFPHTRWRLSIASQSLTMSSHNRKGMPIGYVAVMLALVASIGGVSDIYILIPF